jgi:hypothetical protein
MKELTAKQLQACKLVDTGISINEAARRLGQSYQAVRDKISAAHNKLGDALLIEMFPLLAKALKITEPKFGGQPQLYVTKSLMSDGDPDHPQSTSPANQSPKRGPGRPPNDPALPSAATAKISALKAMKDRMSVVQRKIEVITETDIDDDQLREQVRKKVAIILACMDDYALSHAKLSELSTAFKGLFEAKQLLDGKPTQILDSSERASLAELMPKLFKEAKRRGINLEKAVKGEVIEQ